MSNGFQASRVDRKKLQKAKDRASFAREAHLRECELPPKDPSRCTWPAGELPKRPPGRA